MNEEEILREIRELNRHMNIIERELTNISNEIHTISYNLAFGSSCEEVIDTVLNGRYRVKEL